MARIVYICTVSASLGFLEGILPYLRAVGHEVSVICSPGIEIEGFTARTGIAVDVVPMSRAITPLKDLKALLMLCKSLRRLRPDIVHAQTPKAGLLGMLASRLLGISKRVYHLWGLRVSTTTGFKRWLLLQSERIASGCANLTIVVSPSLHEEAKSLGLLRSKQVQLIVSTHGVDAEGRFVPTMDRIRGRHLREQLNIPAEALVVGFVGRFAIDKGLRELAAAWHSLRERHANYHLLLVGSADDAAAAVVEPLLLDERVHHIEFTRDTPAVYEAMDVLALPTYREGFPNVILEAAAMKVPQVSTEAVGARDAVLDCVTGLLVPLADSSALAKALERLLEDENLRTALAENSRNRVLKEFVPSEVFEKIGLSYESL